MKKTVCDLLIKRFRSHPDSNAIGWVEDSSVKTQDFKSYKELIEVFSLALMHLGLSLQDKVSLISGTRYEWNIADLGILSAGGVTIPIYPSYTTEELVYIINHSECSVLILEDQDQWLKLASHTDKIQNVKKIFTFDDFDHEIQDSMPSQIKYFSFQEVLDIGKSVKQESPDLFDNNIQNIDSNHIASIVYTSGTTGNPKGAIIKHTALYQVLINIEKYARGAINEQDRFLTYLPLSHVLGRLESLTLLVLGNEIIYAESMEKLIPNIQLTKPSILVAVPRVLEKIHLMALNQVKENQIKKYTFEWAMKVTNLFYDSIEQDRVPSSTLLAQFAVAKKFVFKKIYELFGGRIRYFISGGAPLDVEVIKFLRNSGLTVLEGYGLTETVAPCTINPLSKQVPGTVGQPIGDVQIKFLEDGEILIKSQALFSGYYKDKVETERVLDTEGWFHTGDIGAIDSQGFLKITDRKKDIIITSSGKNIPPQKIEALIKRSPYIEHCLVIGDKRKYLSALIAVSREHLSKHFEEFEIPEDCDFIDIAAHPSINKLIQQGIDEANIKLASFETVKSFKILPVEVSQDNFLTPSLKLKKKKISKKYRKLIDAMY